MSTQNLVANLCNLLRDDGVTYHEYINELTYLIFLKMVQETNSNQNLVRRSGLFGVLSLCWKL